MLKYTKSGFVFNTMAVMVINFRKNEDDEEIKNKGNYTVGVLMAGGVYCDIGFFETEEEAKQYIIELVKEINAEPINYRSPFLRTLDNIETAISNIGK